MNPSKVYSPIYRQFITLLNSGLACLDDETQSELREFVGKNQHVSGSFIDRGGAPDLYYSLFGYWMAEALMMNKQLESLKDFISTKKKDEHTNTVDRYALMLIELGTFENGKPRIQLARQIFNRDYKANFSYQLFLFLLVFDAKYGRKYWLYTFVRLWLRFYKPPVGSPCSMIAALVVARAEVGLDSDILQKQLLTFFDANIGFKAFDHLNTGDMLSTSVALFALKKTGFDMRIIAPACLDFIQRNYDHGAFLSGDGDETRDLEYTFYGLLALGCLASSS